MRVLWSICLLLSGLLLLVCSSVGRATEADEAAAVAASKTWLAEVDRGAYRGSWNQAAAYFKQAVKPEQWEAQVSAVRVPLGRVVGRRLKSKQFATSLPGAPDGAYVVIQYQTEFEHKKSAIETITPMKQKDGTWKVSGYYIK